MSFLLLECSAGRFGLNCRHKCACENGGICDKRTGHCECGMGWTGKRCERGMYVFVGRNDHALYGACVFKRMSVRKMHRALTFIFNIGGHFMDWWLSLFSNPSIFNLGILSVNVLLCSFPKSKHTNSSIFIFICCGSI